MAAIAPPKPPPTFLATPRKQPGFSLEVPMNIVSSLIVYPLVYLLQGAFGSYLAAKLGDELAKVIITTFANSLVRLGGAGVRAAHRWLVERAARENRPAIDRR